MILVEKKSETHNFVALSVEAEIDDELCTPIALDEYSPDVTPDIKESPKIMRLFEVLRGGILSFIQSNTRNSEEIKLQSDLKKDANVRPTDKCIEVSRLFL